MNGLGPSHHKMEEGGPSRANIQSGIDTNILVQMTTHVARDVVQEALAQTKPPNQNCDSVVPCRTVMPPPRHEAEISFERSRDLAYLKEFMQYKSLKFNGKINPLIAEN